MVIYEWFLWVVLGDIDRENPCEAHQWICLSERHLEEGTASSALYLEVIKSARTYPRA